MQRIQVIDSHTGGEPTRVVVAGGPDLSVGTLAQRREWFREHHDAFRRAIICEPRGSDVLVGALLCPPIDPGYVTGVIFFNNVGYLGMCGHAAIGVGVTLGHLGRIDPGKYVLDTPVGAVPFQYDGLNKVTLENVPSYRFAADVAVEVDGLGKVVGDVAWGGNWFFLVRGHDEILELSNVARLTDVTLRIRAGLHTHGVTGAGGAEIDHIELFGAPRDSRNHSRNFVLCPGGVYDRSPCGTGTSAKIACLASSGQLRPGELWRQEGILGSVFEGSYRIEDQQVIPQITGQAYVTAEAKLLIDESDPLAWGIRS